MFIASGIDFNSGQDGSSDASFRYAIVKSFFGQFIRKHRLLNLPVTGQVSQQITKLIVGKASQHAFRHHGNL